MPGKVGGELGRECDDLAIELATRPKPWKPWTVVIEGADAKARQPNTTDQAPVGRLRHLVILRTQWSFDFIPATVSLLAPEVCALQHCSQIMSGKGVQSVLKLFSTGVDLKTFCWTTLVSPTSNSAQLDVRATDSSHQQSARGEEVRLVRNQLGLIFCRSL